MFLNKFLFQKLGTFTWEFIVISRSYTTTDPNERNFVIAILPDTRLITEPRALLQLAFCLVNLLGILAPYPQAHLLIGEIVRSDVFLENQVKEIDSKTILQRNP